MKTIKNFVIVLIVCSAITVTAIGVENNNQATSSAQNIQANAPSTSSDQTLDQIIAEKKANDHPKPITDRVGKLEKNLSDKSDKALPTDKFIVAIWVKDDGVVQIPKDDNNSFSSNIAKINASISAKQKPLKDYLNSKNLKIIYTSTFAPVVFAEGTKADIKDLEARDDVTLIQSETTYEDLIYSSVPSILAPPVWNFVSGGVKVAVVEDDGIAFANPYLNDGIYYNSGSPNIGSHATGVGGIIARTNPSYTGVAFNGPALLSANSQTLSDSDLMAATDWALNNGARVISNSWGANTGGSFTALTYYEDYIVTRYPYPTVIFASGNCGACGSPYSKVAAPGLGYNVLAVGSSDDKGTGYASLEDDVMSTYSSYGASSPHGDRELPQVSAVGCHDYPASFGIYSTTTSSPWIGNIGCGTSFAAPEVSGMASLLIYKQPDLGTWPEAVRAIIIASSDHNIQDNNVARWNNKMLRPPAGNGVDVLGAYNTVNNGLYTYGTLGYNSGAPWYGPNIYANAGQKVRVVFTWDSDSTGYSGTDIMHEDLDLSIQRWDGASWIYEGRAGSSASWDNNYEIVEFDAPATGYYRAQISKYRWDISTLSTYFGYAAYVK